MEEKVSLTEASRRWQVLLSRKRHSDELGRPAAADSSSGATDPFGCADCAVLVIPELAVAPVARAVQAWRTLDERKIAAADHQPQQQNGGSTPAKKPKWYNKHVRLPHSFDYSSSQPEPPVDDGTGDRVLRLDHPTATSSYAAELWHVFRSVPKRSVLEAQSVEGLSLPATKIVSDSLWEWEEKNRPSDKMAVVRIRANDRHGPPEAPFRWSSTMGASTGTLFFEVWKGRTPHLKRTSSPDSDRLVLEFLGEQTLLDFHMALIELRQDTYWDSTVRKGDKAQRHNEKSGLFVMENVFYTHGAVDYAKPILEWIQQDTKRAQSCLGPHHADGLQVQAMEDLRLDQIALRLGVRYFHVHHGTMEAQVFLVDRRHGSPRQPTVSYPIIHDLWGRGYNLPECDACRCRLAVYATSTECDITDGHRVLCQACADQLRIPGNHIMAYHEWKAAG